MRSAPPIRLYTASAVPSAGRLFSLKSVNWPPDLMKRRIHRPRLVTVVQTGSRAAEVLTVIQVRDHDQHRENYRLSSGSFCVTRSSASGTSAGARGQVPMRN